MPGDKDKDIIDIILSGNDDKSAPEIKELDCLIYRNGVDMPKTGGDLSQTDIEKGTPFRISKKNVSVEVWKSKIKIRVRVSPESKGNISIERIANVAVDAILKELKKEAK